MSSPTNMVTSNIKDLPREKFHKT